VQELLQGGFARRRRVGDLLAQAVVVFVDDEAPRAADKADALDPAICHGLPDDRVVSLPFRDAGS
jgi:hypothetical protein